MRGFFLFILFCSLSLLPFSQATTHAEEAAKLQFKISNEFNQIQTVFEPFEKAYSEEISFTATDLGNDGIEEILIGNGKGLTPKVQVFRQDGSKIGDFLAYDENFKGGVTVTTCDLNLDGKKEIITGTQGDGGPHVRAFDSYGDPLHINFFAYAEDFLGGVDIACGNVTGDAYPEIITIPHQNGGPHIKVFSHDGTFIDEIFAGDASDISGRSLTTEDSDNDGLDEIFVAAKGLTEPYLWTISAKDHLNIIDITLLQGIFGQGVEIEAFSYHQSPHLLVTAKTDLSAQMYITDIKGNLIKTLQPFSQEDISLLSTPLTESSATFLSASFETPTWLQEGKYIYVDLSEQKLYAYENGILINSFLVSTGRPGKDTPIGITEVTDKLLWHDYQWNYGPDDPRNYYLPDVKYNLRFRDHYYIHYAYWHNDFGFTRSSGCVNVNYENSEWIYNWAEVGTPVEIAP